jgi:pectate lyase
LSKAVYEKEAPNLGEIMMYKKLFFGVMDVLFSLFLVAILSVRSFSLPAFPGAEGFGSETPGGRGGQVIKVTNLNASGYGSLDSACRTSGARIIVFRTGGTIVLSNDIVINQPFVTVAGQTAPGDGICIRGGVLKIKTHDVIVRGLRIRVGDDPNGPDPDDRDGIDISNRSTPPYNIIIDHCSISWAIDGNLDFWYPCHDITVQYCLLSEALHKSLHSKGGHSTALLVGDHAKQISIHHNLMAHNNGRNPLMKWDTETEIINNVVYNWDSWGCTNLSNYKDQDFTVAANIIGNYYKPLQRSSSPIHIDSKTRAGSKVYVKGNIGPGRPSDSGDDWLLVSGDAQHRVDTFALQPSGITVQPVIEVFEHVLENAGAIVPHRDTVDRRAVQTTRDSTGKIIDSQDEVGGWPVYASGTPPVDSDHDGMPDAWENEKA